MPCKPFGVQSGAQGVCERTVRRAALGGRRGVEDRRAHERMAEGDASLGEHEQAGVLGRFERGPIDPGRGEGFGDGLHVVRQRDGDDDERSARVGREPFGAPRECSLERRSGGNRVRQRLVARQLGRAERARDLQQRERVAAGRQAEAPHDLGRDVPTGFGEQPLGILDLERPQLKLLESGCIERALLAVADGEEDRRRICDEPLHGEDQRVARRDVHPLRVVDDDEQRIVLSGRRQEAQGCRADREAVVRSRLAEPQRAP